jgi:hypothetical protein
VTGGDVDELVDVDVWCRGIRAHAAGVRPLVAVEGALEVLHGRQRNRVYSIAQREHRYFRPLEQLFDYERMAECGGGRQRRVELVLRAAHEDAPAASPSALITHGGRATGSSAAAGTLPRS